MAIHIYDSITAATAKTARDAILEDLDNLTDGHVQEVLRLATAYTELNYVIQKYEDLEVSAKPKLEPTKDLSFEEMLG